MSGRMKPPDEPLDARGLRFAIVAARFNHEITERLVEGALECFTAGGNSDVPVEWVPGSFELPLASRALAETRGVSLQQIHRYEIGANTLSVAMLWQLAECLGVSVQYFFEGLD